MSKVFIDGSAGTTGLRIYERLAERDDITLITLPDELRKDINARKDALNSADIAFLCLPDQAAIEAVSLLDNPNTAIIDTSTAHRTEDGWAYGFAELCGKRELIKNSKRIANPGCHASGFVALVAPLVEQGMLPRDALLSCFSLTGYSGGGKGMIAQYEATDLDTELLSPRQYAMGQTHKHLPEMSKICGLENAPVFCPIVSNYYSGMQVTVPLFASTVNGTKDGIAELYKDYYKNGLVSFVPDISSGGFANANKLSGYDNMHITVSGNDERILLIAEFDNLGKGASGAAIQNMNILLGCEEDKGLVINRLI